MPNSSCMVRQCTISETASTAQDSASSVAAPVIAGRTASVSHPGRSNRVNSRPRTREPTPMSAPRPWTARTPVNASNAFGVCSSVITDAASWTMASDSAVRNSGPPSAAATIQRMTNHDPCGGVTPAVLRAVPQTIRTAGTSGRTPIC